MILGSKQLKNVRSKQLKNKFVQRTAAPGGAAGVRDGRAEAEGSPGPGGPCPPLQGPTGHRGA